jgi:hypothetical protein
MANTLAKVFGVVFLLIGVLGFFNDPVFGLFEVDAAHNIVHIVLGLILLAVPTVMGLRVVGVIYLLVAILGFALVPDHGDLLGVELNHADHWLHIVFAVALLAASWCPSNRSMRDSAPMA